jgi:hypothetical protein
VWLEFGRLNEAGEAMFCTLERELARINRLHL